jgi:nitroimidazol reductase NimA-like FMN-containing flavoprotein (pyridoxamine 5'-phosphate oxidase superfamily)
MAEDLSLIKNYEDVTVYGLDTDQEAELVALQNECTFVWTTRDGSPMAVIMSYLEHDGKFWMTASGQRKRVPALRRDGRCAIVISSTGTPLRAGMTVTYKGQCEILEDDETKAWFYPALAERLMSKWGQERVDEFAKMLGSPRRVIMQVTPGLRVGYDGNKMHQATVKSRDAGFLD